MARLITALIPSSSFNNLPAKRNNNNNNSSTIPAMPSFSTWFSSWSPFNGDSTPRRVVSSAITEVEKPMHPNQRAQKIWTISKNSEADAGIKDLCIATPGLTVIKVDPLLLGSDTIARVRVTSDKSEHLECIIVSAAEKKSDCNISFKPKSGCKGHLVTEITISTVDHLNLIAVAGGGDVVLDENILTRTHHRGGSKVDESGDSLSVPPPAASTQPPSLILVAVFGSRLFACAPEADIELNSLAIATAGSSSIYFAARRLTAHTEVAMAMVGAGRVHLATQQFETKEAKLYSIGQDGTMLLTANERFKAEQLDVYVRGASVVDVVVAPDAVVACTSQSLAAKHSGRIIVADVQAQVTNVKINDRQGGHVVIRAPQTELTVKSKRGVGVVEYQGGLPSVVREGDQSILMPWVPSDYQPHIQGVVAVPSIAAAFESAVPLEKPREGFWTAAVRPFLQF